MENLSGRLRVKTQPRLAPHIRQRDRISNLPDSLLHNILTFLPLNEAIRSSVLSKRWAHLWATLPTLVFRELEISPPTFIEEFSDSDEYSPPNFVSLVDETLLLYRSLNLQKFGISYDFHTSHQRKVDLWVHFAVIRKVKHLELIFHPEPTTEHIATSLYLFGKFLCRNEHLTTLSLKYCKLLGSREIKWPLLKKLSIQYTHIHGVTVEKICKYCTLLECLELTACEGIYNLNIVSASLKELVWDTGRQYGSELQEILRISAPGLKLLVISGCLPQKCQFENLGSLLEARLDFKLYNSDKVEDYSESEQEDYSVIEPEYYSKNFKILVKDTLESVQHVKKLALGPWFLQVLSLCSAEVLPSSLPICRSLTLYTNLKKWDLPGLASILKSCPELGTLTIDMTTENSFKICPVLQSRFPNDYDGKNFWTLQLKHECFSCLLEHLKCVNIIGIATCSDELKNVIEFLEFILKHGKALEKLSINTKLNRKSIKDMESSFELSQSLLKFARSSSALIQLT